MPLLERGATTIAYEETGSGFPVLLLAPGGMRSTIEFWERAALNPLAEYADEFRLIAMDQRNAGRSVGPLDTSDPWGSYLADQLALVDHLGIDRFHVIGCCIGGSYILRLLQAAPERILAAVLEQPIGIDAVNPELFDAMWRSWAGQLVGERPDIDPAQLEAFGVAMWSGEFVLSVSRDFVRTCETPMLVLPGIDEYHPTAIGREIAALAPHGEVLEPWKDTPEDLAQAVVAVRQFLRSHTPD